MAAPCPSRPTDPQLPPMEDRRQTERAHGEAGREAQTADDATKSKRDEKEACDEGILFIEGSAKRARRNDKSAPRSHIGRSGRTSVEEEAIKHARPGQT